MEVLQVLMESPCYAQRVAEEGLILNFVEMLKNN